MRVNELGWSCENEERGRIPPEINPVQCGVTIQNSPRIKPFHGIFSKNSECPKVIVVAKEWNENDTHHKSEKKDVFEIQ